MSLIGHWNLNEGSGTVAKDVSGSGVIGNISHAPLVGYWDFNEGSGITTTADKSPNGNNGTLVGMTEASWITGINGTGLNFNGVDQSVNCGDIPEGASAVAITVSAWVKPTTGIANHDIVFNKENYIEVGWATGNAVQMAISVDATAWAWICPSLADTVPLDVWTHVVYTWSGASDVVTVYINGVSNATEAWAGTALTDNTNVFEIGKRSFGAHWVGGIDEVRVYDRILPLADIQALYRNARTEWVDGIAGKALNFDGVDGHIALGNPAALQIIGSQTISMWLKPAVLASRVNPFAKAYGGEGTITQEIDGTVNYFYGTAGTNAAPYQGFKMTSTIVVNVWVHLVIVRDLTGMVLSWYKNGVLTESVAADYAEAVASTLPAYIGRGYVLKYDGLIDEVRIYNHALTAAEVEALYRNPSGASSAIFFGSNF